jgi:hypothetical protein
MFCSINWRPWLDSNPQLPDLKIRYRFNQALYFRNIFQYKSGDVNFGHCCCKTYMDRLVKQFQKSLLVGYNVRIQLVLWLRMNN